MSVTSRPVGCRTSAPPLAFQVTNKGQTCEYDRSKLQTRRDFHETFANLIKLGSTSDKQESKVSNFKKYDLRACCSTYIIYCVYKGFCHQFYIEFSFN